MARVWGRRLPEGVRDGVNTTFVIPGLPGNEVCWIYLNGVKQYEVAAVPDIDECVRAGSLLVMGMAPSSSDLFWVVFASESGSADLDLTVATGGLGTAQAYLNQLRSTFYYSVHIKDKQGNLKEIITGDIAALNWSYGPVGGCLDAQITLRRPFDQHGDIQKDYEVEIWRDVDPFGEAGARLPAQLPIELGTAFSGTRELRWSGYVFEKQATLAPDVGGANGEAVNLRCLGWSRRLNRLAVFNTTPYSLQDVGAVVRSLIDNFVLAGSKIKRTAALDLVQNTGVNIDSIEFKTYAANALQTLASIGGDCEWGVRADKEFFFTPRQNEVKQTHAIGNRVLLYVPLESSDDEVHRVYLQGGDGTVYELNGAPFETGNQKDAFVNVGSIMSATDAALWGAGYFATRAPGASAPSGRLTIGGGADWLESVGLPIGLLRVIGGPVFVAMGTRLPADLPISLGTIYGGYTNQSFRVQQIQYTPENDALKVDVQLGSRGNELADLLSSIEFKLGEINQALQT